MDFQWSLVWSSVPTLLEGALLTLQLTSIAVFFGIILGTIFGIMRLSKTPLRYLAAAYIDFIRGTPLLVQIFIIYYGVPTIIKQAVPPYVAAVIALSINSGAYVAEIVRAGIQSIEKGQTEAALSLGMSKTATMIHIILPQAFKRIVPPLGNEFIALLKDSSLVSAIALEELVRKAQIVAGRTFRPFEVWFVVAIMYLIMTVTISQIVRILERRLRVGE
ncbi:MAG: amino acid ABC transporter permease [Candidatus Wallacebacter cryptica]|jgi:glutamine transport system permease protein|nr:amino acid ABC transporter permease [Bacillota bacterium]